MAVMCCQVSDIRYKTIFCHSLFLFIVFDTICPDGCSRVSIIHTYVHLYTFRGSVSMSQIQYVVEQVRTTKYAEFTMYSTVYIL